MQVSAAIMVDLSSNQAIVLESKFLSSIIEDIQKLKKKNADLPKEEQQIIPGIDEKRIWKWIHQAIVALGQLHAEGKLHYNLTCANISVNDKDNIELSDPGADPTKVGDVDPAYISPETITCSTFDHKSDMWALGCVFHELITLTRPFTPSPKKDPVALIVMDAPSKILKKDYNYSWHLRMLPRWLLQKDPEFRPSALDVYVTVWSNWKVYTQPKQEKGGPVVSWDETTIPSDWTTKLDVDTVKLWDTEGHIVGVLKTAPTWESVKASSVEVLLPKVIGDKMIVLEVAGVENSG